MTIRVEIIATGSELLHNKTKNTTTPFLVNQLIGLGYEIKRISTVDDGIEEITGAVCEALRRADLILLTGGLGATPDDVTREAVAEALSMPMEFRSDLWEEIQQYFDKRDLSTTPINMKQAYLPCGAYALHNPLGTAPGILIPYDEDVTIVVLPGPPGETREMFLHEVKPYLIKHYPPPASHKVCTFKICGCGETVVCERIKDVIREARESGIKCSFLSGPDEVQLILELSDPGDDNDNNELLKKLGDQIQTLLGPDLYGVNEETLMGKVGEMLIEKGFTVGVAESCTGGLVASYLTDVPGSSGYVRGGVVAYSSEAKEKVLGVSPDVLKDYGAVSPETAKEMARGVRELMNTSIGLSTTGLAGPQGGEPEIPVGTVYLGLSTSEGEELVRKIYYPKVGRLTLKTIAAKRALDFLRRYLINSSGVD
ncbi:MAG TPA: competence/damage-inducible protein A [Syntrophomonadaceae bacterium]|nr:competence/damage-inducible protein A [Syntrophomonadaceae bacterium]